MTTNPLDLNQEFGLISEAEYAAFAGKTIPSVRNERARGRGPAFVKVGSKVKYRRADIEAYLRQNTHQPQRAPTLIESRLTRRNARQRPA